MPVIDDKKYTRLAWLDVVRGIAILWIFWVHFIERFLPGSMFANPHFNWPPLGDRIAQLTPLDVHGLADISVNLLRYIGWLGDQGVQIFLVASGFGLALSALKGGRPFSAGSFYRKRIARILPLWIVAHFLFIGTYIFLSKGLSPLDWRTWASLSGLRFLPQVFYFKFPAWWYIGVLLQLYLLFPLLMKVLQRWPPWRFLLIIGGIGVITRLAGLYIFDHHLDWWSRGGIFLSRLPEFAFGMAFAKWLVHTEPKQIDRLKGATGVLVILAFYMLGNACSFFLAGMSVAFLMTGAGLFLLIFALFSGKGFKSTTPVEWAGRRSYSLYLMHHPVILFMVPAALAPTEAAQIWMYLVVTLCVSIVGALFLEKATNILLDIHRRWSYQTDPPGLSPDG